MKITNKKLFQIPATISKIETMAHKSLKIIINTQENMREDDIFILMNMYERLGWFTFVVNQKIEPDDLLDLPDLKIETDIKSPSQRFRAVLYRLWEKKGKNGTFNNYYINCMEKLINMYKEKLD